MNISKGTRVKVPGSADGTDGIVSCVCTGQLEGMVLVKVWSDTRFVGEICVEASSLEVL